MRRFAEQMIVQRRLFDPTLPQRLDHRSDFRLEQDQVTH